MDEFWIPTRLFIQAEEVVHTHHARVGYGCLPKYLSHPAVKLMIGRVPGFEGRCIEDRFWTAPYSRFGTMRRIASVFLVADILDTGFAGWKSKFSESGDAVRQIFQGNVAFETHFFLEVYLPHGNEVEPQLIKAFGPLESDQIYRGDLFQ